MAHVRDRPSLRESVEITTPSGNRYRWGDDEDSPANAPSGERFSDTMPGGFAEHEAVLPRKASVDYADLERLSTLTRYDAGGEVIWQGRLERAPKVSGDQMAISPSAVGWQAHLEDDKSVREIYVDRDLSRWVGISSRQRRINVSAGGYGVVEDPMVDGDTVTGLPSVRTRVPSVWSTGQKPISETWYDGNGVDIAKIHFNWQKSSSVAIGDGNWQWVLGVATNELGSVSVTSGNQRVVTLEGTDNYFIPTTAYPYAFAQMSYEASPGGADNIDYTVWWRNLAVYGNHELTGRGDDDPVGFYASDIVGHAVGRFAPLLDITAESVQPSDFVIAHMTFLEPTTCGEIVRQATRFGLQDWAVWEDLTFWWHDRGARGRKWRARTGPSQLEETGPQVERIWESVIVQYQDPGGLTRTVGPVGSGSNTETDDLKDNDPDNPANRLGITRRALLVMGVGTTASATEVGRRFLEESRLLDSSGRARLVGHVQDSHGVWHPYSHVRAGDTISFVDSSDASYRRIVRTDKTRDDRSCSIDLDAPPEGLAALLERLGVVLVPLGV